MTHRWILLSTSAVIAQAVAFLVVNTLPAITGVLARNLGFQAQMLGAFGSADVLGSAVGTLLAVFVMRHTSPRATVTSGLLLLFASNLSSAGFEWGPALVGVRAVGGIGTGLTVTSCIYIYSLRNRERNYAASMLGMTALAAGVITVIPPLVHRFGWRAMFMGLALLVVPCLILARSFPSGYGDEARPQLITGPAPQGVLWLGLVSVALSNLGILSLWTYLERIGASAGIAEATIANSLSMCSVFGFISSALVLVVGERVTRTTTLVICVILNIVGALASGSSIAWVYTAGVLVFYFSLPIYLASQFGAIMRSAPSKLFATQFSLAAKVGALGPAIGGLFAARYGFGAVRWIDIILVLGASALLWSGFIRHRAAGHHAAKPSA